MKLIYFRCWLCGLVVAVTLGACSKGEPVDLTADNLTACTGCKFHYRVNAQLEGWNIVDGKSRVFTYDQGSDSEHSMYEIVHIEIPTSRKSFVMKGEEIGNGKVAYLFVCPFCNTVAVKPIGGFIQGQKVADNKWLVDATVELAAVHSGDPAGSISFKQYFTPVP